MIVCQVDHNCYRILTSTAPLSTKLYKALSTKRYYINIQNRPPSRLRRNFRPAYQQLRLKFSLAAHKLGRLMA